MGRAGSIGCELQVPAQGRGHGSAGAGPLRDPRGRVRAVHDHPRAPALDGFLYRYAFAKHIGPKLGGWSMRNLDVHAVESWYADLDAGPEARSKAARVLRALTSFAHRRGLIPTDPGRVLVVPASRVRSLNPDDIPTRAQVELLATEVSEDYRPLIELLAFGGPRIGEAIALRVDRVDFERRRITVDSSASEAGGVLTFGKPKTHASERSFTAPRFLLELGRQPSRSQRGSGTRIPA